jgi:hypothetical protein
MQHFHLWIILGENRPSHLDAPSYTYIKQSLEVNGYSESSPLFISVGDRDLDPDPHVFGPSGSGSISQRYGSGSFPFLINVFSVLT